MLKLIPICKLIDMCNNKSFHSKINKLNAFQKSENTAKYETLVWLW